MNGTDLKPLPSGSQATWTIGGEAEVTWQISNNHGGGYAYRLCPAETPGHVLSEACFQVHTGNHAIARHHGNHRPAAKHPMKGPPSPSAFASFGKKSHFSSFFWKATLHPRPRFLPHAAQVQVQSSFSTVSAHTYINNVQTT